ncbi:hypothetical protein BKA67DRAFT_10242 [Truncatella angustata]|uniref:phosphatidylinositol-3,4,5-trisphosphate 3-phosphatase n=1 Tax=Truncatella angustata TaxID=152316 RepID=A0A9P8UVU3_9PEZI|nr:uncharacterized protein BKA67DRAFT_10242 [Truncatella angustata]KAH6659308.1 hypothetical protein BKA67DRAFT_10242 [Truncatella angustata]
MASILRQIVAGPRARHPEAGLDLCYVTDNIIATSGPSDTYPQRAYRNPLDRLVAFLDEKHKDNWAIWEFRAEGTGYPDDAVYNRIRHYPWPDHHPPPFRLIPLIMASMRNWLEGNDLHDDTAARNAHKDKDSNLVGKVIGHWKDMNKNNPRVIVVHCKAGKGRSGSTACSFLISECGWKPEQALARFTERRMRPKFGPGVSIPSQLRWVGYVDRWTKGGKKYVDREVEILEVHVWGLRNGVKFAVEGFVDEGKKIKVFHTFNKKERHVVEGDPPGSTGIMDTFYDMAGYGTNPSGDAPGLSPEKEREVINDAREPNTQNEPASATTQSESNSPVTPSSSTSKLSKRYTKLIERTPSTSGISRSKSKKEKAKDKIRSSASASSSTSSLNKASVDTEPGGKAVIFKPLEPVRVPTSDVNITAERRNRAPSSMGLTMVTAVAHVWFNAFFEGNGPEQDGKPEEEGIFEIEWDKMDGIKGSSQRGTKAMERIAVVWRFAPLQETQAEPIIVEPDVGEPVPQMEPANWKGGNEVDPGLEKKLGLRVQSPDSASVSQASSINEQVAGHGKAGDEDDLDSLSGVKSDIGGAPSEASAEEVGEDQQYRGRKGKEVSEHDKLAAYKEKLPSPEGSEGAGNGAQK